MGFYGLCMVRKALGLMEMGPPWGHTRWVTRWVLISYYPRDAMLARVYATAFLSVCLCVTRVLCIKTAKRFVEILLPSDSTIILVFRHRGSLLNSYGFIPNRGAEYNGVRKLGDFW